MKWCKIVRIRTTIYRDVSHPEMKKTKGGKMLQKILCWLGYHQWSNWKKTGFTSGIEIHWGGRCVHCNHYESMWFRNFNPPEDMKRYKYRVGYIR